MLLIKHSELVVPDLANAEAVGLAGSVNTEFGNVLKQCNTDKVCVGISDTRAQE
jgi:hypothetical protein